MRPRVCVLALALLALAPIESASAAPDLVTSAYQFASRGESLALAGSVQLATGLEGNKADVVRSFAPGRSPVVVARVHPEGEGRGQIFLAGSPNRIALLEEGATFGEKGCCTTFHQHVASGPLGGPLTEQTAGCRIAPSLDESVGEEPGIPAHSAIALDGEVLAYDSFGCVVIRDFASGLQRIIPLEATLRPVHNRVVWYLRGNGLLRVAGRLIAYRANPLGGEGPASVVVYDIDAGRELYRVAVEPLEPEQGSPTFDLQSDGTLVVADGASCSATVSTIAQPAPRPLGIPACEVSRVRNGRALLVVPSAGLDRRLAWTSITAPLAHEIADLGEHGALAAATADLDETNVLYALSGCWAPSVYQATLAEPGSPPAPPESCPVTVLSRYATLTAKTLRVRIRCPLGCEGELTAFAGTAKELRRAEGGTSLRGIWPREISVRPGGSTNLTFKPAEQEPEAGADLLRALNRRLRRQHRLDLRLELNIQTPNAHGDETFLRIVNKTHHHVVIPIRLQMSRGHPR